MTTEPSAPPPNGDYWQAIDEARRRIEAKRDAAELQRRREVRFLKWTLAAAIVWAAWELHRLADRIAGLLETTP